MREVTEEKEGLPPQIFTYGTCVAFWNLRPPYTRVLRAPE